jgi:PAS domain-containing protein
MNIMDIRPDEDREPAARAVASVQGYVFRGGIWRHRKKDGTIFHVDIAAHAIDYAGRPAVMIMADDVTERVKAEAALRRSEEQYRRLVEISPDAIFINRDNSIVFANPAMVKLMGAENSTQITGMRPLDVFHHDSHELVSGRIKALHESGQAVPPP